MKFELIDYSPLYFRNIAKKDMPAKRSGKFLQILNEDSETEYLVLSPKELSSFHANILERFCMIKKISGSYTNKKMDNFEIDDPTFAWTVIGGGLWVMDDDAKTLHLSGSSGSYGKFASRGLKKKILTVKKMSDYSISIK